MRPIAPLAALAFMLSVSVPGLAAQPEPASQRHTLWTLAGKTNTVYLLGSVHLLRPSEKFPPVIDAAYEDAESLLMEIDMDDLDPIETQKIMLELGMLPPEDSLERRLGKATYATVAEHAQQLGLAPAMLDRLQPWLAAITLVQLNMLKMGLAVESGVEQQLTARAGADGKEIRGLETLREQIGMLAALRPDLQEKFLLYSVNDAQRAGREIDALIDAWRSGDTKTLAGFLKEGFDEYPDLYQPLTIDRNRKWIASIEDLLDDSDDYLVVVGALHLVGRDSVIDLLEKKGHKVEQR